jgi:hypothetical protein
VSDEPQSKLNGLRHWLQTHLDAVAGTAIVVGFVLRLVPALTRWLHSDDIQNFSYSDHARLADVWRDAYQGGHPPVYHFLLFVWRFLGRSDVILLLPSVILGTALLWFAYRWLKVQFDPTTALIGAILLASAPEMVLFSTELRQYALLLLLEFAALATLSQALSTRSARAMLGCSLLLALAVLTDYMAIWLALGLAAHGLWLVLRRQLTGRARTAWLAGQAIVLATIALLYVTQLANLRGSGAEDAARHAWLQSSYFTPARGNFALFLVRQTFAIFSYFFSSPLLGGLGLVLALAGIVLIMRQPEPRTGRALIPIVVLPFAVTALAALTGLSPFGGSRHCLPLAVLTVAPVSYALARLVGARTELVLASALVLIPAWRVTTHTAAPWYIAPSSQRRELMLQATDYLHTLAPHSRLVFTDDQGQAILLRYLAPGHARPVPDHPPGFVEYDCAGIRLVSPGTLAFTVGDTANPYYRDFNQAFFQLKEGYNLQPGDTVCVVSAGWGDNLGKLLSRKLGVSYPGLRWFGNNISVFVLPVGQEQQATGPARKAGNNRRALEQLAAAAFAQQGRTRTLLWPTWYLDDSTRQRGRQWAEQVMSYAEFYRAFQPGKSLADYTPARMLWLLDTRERHTRAFGHMAELEDFAIGSFSFTLLETDTNRLAAIYEVRP